MAKQYTHVSELVRDIAPDTEFNAGLQEELKKRAVVRRLMAYRAAAGLSQADVAERMNCSQSRVSKIESSSDDDLRLGDLRQYAASVDCEIAIGAASKASITPVEKVKRHAFAIKKHMDDMVRLVKSDESMAFGVSAFFGEVFCNFFRMLGDSAKGLPRRADGTPYCSFEMLECVGETQEECEAHEESAPRVSG